MFSKELINDVQNTAGNINSLNAGGGCIGYLFSTKDGNEISFGMYAHTLNEITAGNWDGFYSKSGVFYDLRSLSDVVKLEKKTYVDLVNGR